MICSITLMLFLCHYGVRVHQLRGEYTDQITSSFTCFFLLIFRTSTNHSFGARLQTHFLNSTDSYIAQKCSQVIVIGDLQEDVAKF
jgi:hypothetical protein